MARGRRIVAGRRPDYEWSGTTVFTSGLSTTKFATAAATFTGSGTIMRCRGRLRGQLETTAAADSMKMLACGLIVADDDALTVGQTAIPGPTTDPEAEWVWVGQLLLGNLTATEADAGSSFADDIVIDSKAMRKVKGNENLVLVIEPINIFGTETARVGGFIRVLGAS